MSPATLPDVVYVCRPGENDELRISLRSLAKNAAGIYRKVWVVGTVLPWLRNIEPLPLTPLDDKFANQRQSLAAVVNHPDLSETFVLLNDDHFIVEPITQWATFHIGSPFSMLAQLFSVDAAAADVNDWTYAVLNTALWTQRRTGIAPLCYEAHTPLLFDKASLAGVLADYPAGDLFAVGETYPITGAGGMGVIASNTKVAELGAHELLTVMSSQMPYVSTEDAAFADGLIGDWLRAKFPDPRIYEEATA